MNFWLIMVSLCNISIYGLTKILDSKWDFDVVIFFHQLVLIPFFTFIGFLAIFHLNLMIDWLIEWRNRIVCVDWTEERQNSNNGERSYIIHGNLVTQLNNTEKAMWNIHKTAHTKNYSKFDVSTWLHATRVRCVTPLNIAWIWACITCTYCICI